MNELERQELLKDISIEISKEELEHLKHYKDDLKRCVIHHLNEQKFSGQKLPKSGFVDENFIWTLEQSGYEFCTEEEYEAKKQEYKDIVYQKNTPPSLLGFKIYIGIIIIAVILSIYFGK